MPSLVPLFPSHYLFVDVFGGAGNVLLGKPPSPREVYNDLDEGLVNLFRVVKSRDDFFRFEDLARNTTLNRELYERYRGHWQEVKDKVERAFALLLVSRWSFSGLIEGGWGYSTQDSYQLEKVRWDRLRNGGLALYHQRLRNVIIENKTWQDILHAYDAPNALLYLDPPYVSETRRGGGYRHEMTLKDHEKMVQVMLSLSGRVILSGYTHAVYAPLIDAGWRRWDKLMLFMGNNTRNYLANSSNRAMRLRRIRTESIWVSPNAGNFVSLVAPAFGWQQSTIAPSAPSPGKGRARPASNVSTKAVE